MIWNANPLLLGNEKNDWGGEDKALAASRKSLELKGHFVQIIFVRGIFKNYLIELQVLFYFRSFGSFEGTLGCNHEKKPVGK